MTRALAKVLQAFERIVQTNAIIMLAFKGEESDGPPPDLDESVKKANMELTNENKASTIWLRLYTKNITQWEK